MLSLLQKHVQDLGFLAKLDASVVQEFCKLALNMFFKSQQKKKTLSNAAKALGCSVDDVERSLYALSYLFTEVIRMRCSLESLRDCFILHELPFSEDSVKAIYQCCEEGTGDIQRTLAKPLSGQHLYSLNWRLEVSLGGRAMRNSFQPSYVLDFCTKDEQGNKTHHVMESSYAALQSITTALEGALNDIRKTEYRRVSRYVK
eukprot:Rmarinus@m.3483